MFLNIIFDSIADKFYGQSQMALTKLQNFCLSWFPESCWTTVLYFMGFLLDLLQAPRTQSWSDSTGQTVSLEKRNWVETLASVVLEAEWIKVWSVQN